MIIVDKEGSYGFRSIAQALEEAKKYDKPKIFIKKGRYKEKLMIHQPNVTIEGEDAEDTIITNGDYGNNGGTFNSYTVFVGSDGVTFKNLTIENHAGCGSKVGQAVALYANGDFFKAEQCRLIGHQDTLFTGPLPPSERIEGGFNGPGRDLERRQTHQLYTQCYICGDIDFIFGSAHAVFSHCVIESLDKGKSVNGYITAASTPENQQHGYVFYRCKLVSQAKKGTVYLGRPWREHAKVTFLSCDMGEHISCKGWDNWGDSSNEQTVIFQELCCFGAGSASFGRRDPWIRTSDQESLIKLWIEDGLEAFFALE